MVTARLLYYSSYSLGEKIMDSKLQLYMPYLYKKSFNMLQQARGGDLTILR